MNTVALSSIFDIVYGSQLDLNKLEIDLENGINFISRSRENLGVQTKIKKIVNKTLLKKGSITVSLGGSVLSSFVQKKDFYTGQNIKVLTPKKSLTDAQKKFYCMTIEMNAYRYSACGREANKTLNDLLVPSLDSIPKWVNKIVVKAPSKESLTNNKLSLKDREWKTFKLSNLFNITTGKYFNTDSFIEGSTPLISSKDKNNGVKDWTNLEPIYTKGITIGKVDMSSNFQSIPFCVTSDVCVLEKKSLSDFAYLFVCSILGKEKYRWSYGRQIRLNDSKALCIKLPSIQDSQSEYEPDWQFMEDYIKSLPYSTSL